MGLFGIKKKKKQEPKFEIENEINTEYKNYNIEFITTGDDKLQVDFYDKEKKLGQSYDTTRLIVDYDSPIEIAGEEVNKCLVAWYRQNEDLELLNYSDEDEKTRINYCKEVLAQFDIVLLQSEEDYCVAIMKDLFNKKRITKYLESGLIENAETPCGNYVGGIRQTENGYEEFFSPEIGKQVHNSPFMQKCRKEHNESVEKREQQKSIQNENILSETNEDISK